HLTRFWLGTSAASEAKGVEPPPNVPEISPGLAFAIQQLVNAFALAGIYGLLATAYSLIYGLVGRINLAFGGIAVFGAFGAIGGLAAAIALGATDHAGGDAVAFLTAAALAATSSWFIGHNVFTGVAGPHRLRP